MKNLLLWLTVILLIFWVIGAFVYTIGKIIHILLVLALISFLLRFIRWRKKRSHERIEKQ